MIWSGNSSWNGMWSGFWSGFWSTIGVRCNFSTYWNGTEEEDVDFVQEDGIPTSGAPVKSIDRYIGFSDPNNGTILLDYIDATVSFQTANDLEIGFYFTRCSSSVIDSEGFLTTGNSTAGSGNRRLMIIRNGVSVDGFLRFYNMSNGFKAITLNGFFEDEVTNKWDITKVGSSVEVFKNGLSDSITDVTGFETSDADTTRWLSLDYPPSRSTCGFIWDVSVTESGVALYSWAIDEGSGSIANDSSGNENHGIITDGAPVSFWDYYLPRYMVPATGPLQCREDSISNTTLGDRNFSGDWTVSGEMLPLDDGEFDTYFNYGNAIQLSGIFCYRDSLNSITFQVEDDANIAQYVYTTSTLMGTRFRYEIKKDGTTVTTSINGVVVDTDASVDLTTNGLIVQFVAIGSGDATSAKGSVDHYNAEVISDDFNESWNFVTRLPSLTDVNANKIIGTVNGTVLDIIDNSPVGIYYPYIGEWDTSYLISDNPCPDNPLVTNNGIAATNNGEFIFPTP